MRPTLDLERAELPLALAPVELRADETWVARFLEALGVEGRAARELVEQGLAPPYALTGHSIFLAASHFDVRGGVWAREQVTYHAPVRLGQTLRVQGEIERSEVRRDRRYRVMTSHTRDASGRLLVSSCTTSLARYLPDASGSGETRGRPDSEISRPRPDAAAARGNPALPALRALEPGQRVAGPECVITLEMMRAEAGPGGGNPIHTDPEAARRAGLARPIAGCSHVLAFVQEALMSELGAQVLLHGSHFDVRWTAPVPDDVPIRPWARVREPHAERVELELAVECAGARSLAGTATIPLV
jgi:acyl dehydratase